MHLNLVRGDKYITTFDTTAFGTTSKACIFSKIQHTDEPLKDNTHQDASYEKEKTA